MAHSGAEKLYWALPLENIYTQTMTSLESSYYSTINDHYQRKSIKSDQRFIKLTFEGGADDSVKIIEFSYKIKFEKEICSPNRLFPNNFDCSRRCSLSKSLKRASLATFLSFAFFKAETDLENESQQYSIYILYNFISNF